VRGFPDDPVDADPAPRRHRVIVGHLPLEVAVLAEPLREDPLLRSAGTDGAI
jgi:hypothetical protein